MPSEYINITHSQVIFQSLLYFEHHKIVMEAILCHFLVLAEAFKDDGSLPQPWSLRSSMRMLRWAASSSLSFEAPPTTARALGEVPPPPTPLHSGSWGTGWGLRWWAGPPPICSGAWGSCWRGWGWVEPLPWPPPSCLKRMNYEVKRWWWTCLEMLVEYS